MDERCLGFWLKEDERVGLTRANSEERAHHDVFGLEKAAHDVHDGCLLHRGDAGVESEGRVSSHEEMTARRRHEGRD